MKTKFKVGNERQSTSTNWRGGEHNALDYYYKHREDILNRRLELGITQKRGELRCFT